MLEPQTPVPDATLMERLAMRDSTALVELERRHQRSLYAQVYGVLWDSGLAERVVREAFAQMWYTTSELTVKCSAWSWLRETAMQLARAQRAILRPR